MEVIKLIDYAHTRNGTCCSGIVSETAGHLEASWDYDLDGAPTSRVRSVTPAQLSELWSGIAASLTSGGVFSRSLVTDPTRPLDPEAEHLIVAVVERAGQQQCLTFAVPADEAAPEFTAWLTKLDVPEMATLAIAAE